MSKLKSKSQIFATFGLYSSEKLLNVILDLLELCGKIIDGNDYYFILLI